MTAGRGSIANGIATDTSAAQHGQHDLQPLLGFLQLPHAPFPP